MDGDDYGSHNRRCRELSYQGYAGRRCRSTPRGFARDFSEQAAMVCSDIVMPRCGVHQPPIFIILPHCIGLDTF